MLQPLVIWGASGQARVLREFVGTLGYEVVAVFDKNPKLEPPFDGVPLYCGEEGFDKWLRNCGYAKIFGLVAIGSPGRTRMEVQTFLEDRGVEMICAIHPTAFVASNAQIGKGCQILAQAAVAADVRMGNQVIVNTSASVDHESVLGDGVHLAPGARLAGCVYVGSGTFVGIGAIILPRLRIGSNCLVGAGSVVTKDLPDNVVVCGSPARIIRPMAS